MLIRGTTTDDEVYCQFLRSELYRFTSYPDRDKLAAFTSKPDFGDIRQNVIRRQALFSVRWSLLAQLPDPLEWYRAAMEPGDLEELRLIRNAGWNDKSTDDLLLNVQFPGTFHEGDRSIIPEMMEKVAAFDFDRTLILLARTVDGPFTILDGNHRATAMMLAKRKGAFTESDVNAFVGVSPRMGTCIWCAGI